MALLSGERDRRSQGKQKPRTRRNTKTGHGDAARSSCCVTRFLEEELQTKLHNARILCLDDSTESRRLVHRRVGVVEVDGVEQIEELGPELHVDAVREGESLEQPEVDGLAVRTEELASQGVTERPVGVDGECRGVEPDLARRRAREAVRHFEWLPGSNRTVAAQAPARVVDAARDRLQFRMIRWLVLTLSNLR